MQETIEGQSTVKKNTGAPVADVSCLICEFESLFCFFFFCEYACSFFVYCCCGTVNEEKEENGKEVVNFLGFLIHLNLVMFFVYCGMWGLCVGSYKTRVLMLLVQFFVCRTTLSSTAFFTMGESLLGKKPYSTELGFKLL